MSILQICRCPPRCVALSLTTCPSGDGAQPTLRSTGHRLLGEPPPTEVPFPKSFIQSEGRSKTHMKVLHKLAGTLYVIFL